MGRPKGSLSNKDYYSVKIDRNIAMKAKLVASHKGKHLYIYLSDILRDLVDSDFSKLVKEVEEGDMK